MTPEVPKPVVTVRAGLKGIARRVNIAVMARANDDPLVGQIVNGLNGVLDVMIDEHAPPDMTPREVAERMGLVQPAKKAKRRRRA